MEATNNILTEILAIFLQMAEWIADAVPSLVTMFYDTNGLTFLGVLAISGLAMSVAWLLIGVIQKFLHFAG